MISPVTRYGSSIERKSAIGIVKPLSVSLDQG